MHYMLEFSDVHSDAVKLIGPYQYEIQLTYTDIRETKHGETIASWDRVNECWYIPGDSAVTYSDVVIYVKSDEGAN